MVAQREVPSYTPLAARIEARRDTLSPLISEPEIRTYFENMVGFHLRSARRNEEEGKRPWIAAVYYDDDASFLQELESRCQKCLYKFIRGEVRRKLTKTEAELYGFMHPRASKDNNGTSDEAKFTGFSQMAEKGIGILDRNNLTTEAAEFIQNSIALFQSRSNSTLEATKSRHLVEISTNVTVLRNLDEQISASLRETRKPTPVREAVLV